MDNVLQKWADAKAAAAEANKEVERCKTQVEAEMMRQGTDTITTENFEVTKRMQSRESCGKADLPADIFEQYKKTSEFSVLAFKELGPKKKKGGA